MVNWPSQKNSDRKVWERLSKFRSGKNGLKTPNPPRGMVCTIASLIGWNRKGAGEIRGRSQLINLRLKGICARRPRDKRERGAGWWPGLRPGRLYFLPRGALILRGQAAKSAHIPPEGIYRAPPVDRSDNSRGGNPVPGSANTAAAPPVVRGGEVFRCFPVNTVQGDGLRKRRPIAPPGTPNPGTPAVAGGAARQSAFPPPMPFRHGGPRARCRASAPPGTLGCRAEKPCKKK